MNNKPLHDIGDDEIRIISRSNSDGDGCRTSGHSPKRKVIVMVSFVAMVLIGLLIAMFYPSASEGVADEQLPDTGTETEMIPAVDVAESSAQGHVIISDTIVGQVRLTIFRPVDALPELHVGNDILSDSDAVFVVQAADVRSDNGGIVGAYVQKGELRSKGQAKSGFCAIIGGQLTIGVADATPFLEQALASDGYFFRQYPLVVANQLVENKPQGKALRKALAELNGQVVVIMSQEKLTFHDFSQSLVGLGVTNAIYLVGASAYGFAIDSDRNKVVFGQEDKNASGNTNYIVWR